MKHYPTYHFIHHLTFSNIIITSDAVWLKDALFADDVTGKKSQTVIGLPHQAFTDLLGKDIYIADKANLLKNFNDAITHLQPDQIVELPVKAVKLKDFIFRLVESENALHDYPDKAIKTYFWLTAISTLGYGPAYEDQLQLKGEKRKLPIPELRTPGNHHMRMLAMRYQFYLHIKTDKKRRTLNRTARREASLSDPLIFVTARSAYYMAGPIEATYKTSK